MHFCFINMPIEFYSPVSGGAVSTIIMETAQELLKAGHRVSVITQDTTDLMHEIGEIHRFRPLNKQTLNLNEKIFCKLWRTFSKWDWPYYGLYIQAVSKALQKIDNIDVAIVFNDLASPSFLKRILPTSKICIWLQNEQHSRFPALSQTWQSVWRIFTCSDYIANWTIEKYGLPKQMVVTAISGVNNQTFHPRQNFLEPSTTIRALYAGRLDPNKGTDVALEACKFVQDRGLDIHFTIAGDVWFYKRSEDLQNNFRASLFTRIELLNQKELLGHVVRKQMPDVFSQADVVFTLSRSNEPLGLVVLEAMSSGCAVISSNRGGLPEACGGAAVLVNPDEQEQVNQALLNICTDRALLADLKQRSVARAQKASWFNTAEILEKNCR